MHQRKPSQKMHRLPYISGITLLNNDTNKKKSDFSSMSESHVKLCNNNNNNNESSNRCCESNNTLLNGDLPFGRNFHDEEKEGHIFLTKNCQEIPSVNCQCTSYRQNEYFINDVKSVNSDMNNHKGQYQKWKHRLTTSELLSHTRLVEKNDIILEKSPCRRSNTIERLHMWRILLAICIAILCTTCNADPSECAKGINTPGCKFWHIFFLYIFFLNLFFGKKHLYNLLILRY